MGACAEFARPPTLPPTHLPTHNPPPRQQVVREEKALRAALLADELTPQPGSTLARYNEPSVPPPLRRNEVLIKLNNFQWP